MTIVDQSTDCLLRASLRNEGKIHLGFVYANDPGGRTSRLMLESALQFDRTLEEIIGAPIDWPRLHSTRFLYPVLSTSMLTTNELFDVWTSLQQQYEELTVTGSATYLGTRPRTLWHALSDGATAKWLAPGAAEAVVATAELALDIAELCRLLRAVLSSADGVQCRWGHRVESATRTANGYRLDGSTADGDDWSIESDTVVNCLWEDRLRLDAQLDLAPERPWVHRLKHRLLGRLPAALSDLPSFTFVLGPFGDVVTWPGGHVFLSWYPALAQERSSELRVPESWQAPCDGQVDPSAAEVLTRDALCALDEIVPGLAGTMVDIVDAGIITAWGASDIDDRKSGLHRRHEIGPCAFDGWISLDTGKLTTAPVFAQQAAALAVGAAR